MYQKLKNKIYILLRKSEKWTKTDMIYLASGGFWLTAGQIVSAISSFLLAIAFANLLPKEIYGQYKYILSIASLLSIPTLGGLGTALTQAVARGYDGSLIPVLKTKIKWGLLGALFSLFLAGYYYFNGNTTLTFAFLISSIFLPFMDSFGIYNSFLNGRKEFKISTKYGIITQTTVILLVIAIMYFTNNLFLILFTYFSSWTILRYIFFRLTINNLILNNKKDEETISYGKHLSLMNILPLMAQQIDKIIVFHYLGAAQLAIYAFAIAIPEQLKSPFKNIQALIMPKFSDRSMKEISQSIFSKMFKLIIFLLFITVLYIFAAPFIFKIFFPSYTDSIFYSQLFSISIIATALVFPLSALQSKIAKTQLYQFNIIRALFQIITLFIFIYYFEIIGVVIAKILSEFFNFFLLIFLFKKIPQNKLGTIE